MKVYIGSKKQNRKGTWARTIDIEQQYKNKIIDKKEKSQNISLQKRKSICQSCGKEIWAYRTKKYCDKCTNKKYKYYDVDLRPISIMKRNIEVEKRMKEIDTVNSKARKMGLSYGKYMALKRMEVIS